MSDTNKPMLRDEVAILVLNFFKEKVDSTVQMTKEVALTWIGHPRGTGGKGMFGRLYFGDDFAVYYKRPGGENIRIPYSDPDFLDKVREWAKEEYQVKLR